MSYNFYRRLEKIYDDKIIINTSESNYNIQFSIKDRYHGYENIAISINYTHKIAVIWNLKLRRALKATATTLNISKTWEELGAKHIDIKTHYKKVKTENNLCFEKVLILSFDCLNEIIDDLPLYLQFNPEDEDYPNNIDDDVYDVSPEPLRKRFSTSQLERDRNFRKKVLEAYDNECAICRCGEIHILQAAHIKAVNSDGSDDPRNGICLCANHHLMYDNHLINIDFENLILTNVAESVRTMLWYTAFNEIYNGKLKKRKN